MFKITTAESDGARIFRVEGKLLADWVPELLAACHNVEGAPFVEVDLAGLSFVDTQGIAALRKLADQGLRLTNASSFVAELIRENR